MNHKSKFVAFEGHADYGVHEFSIDSLVIAKTPDYNDNCCI